MHSHEAHPTVLPTDIDAKSHDEKLEIANSIIDDVLNHYEYGGFDVTSNNESVINPPRDCLQSTEVIHAKLDDGRILKGYLNEPVPKDDVMAYSNSLCLWCMQLMHMIDTAKEADLGRTVVSVKANIPFFYGHSTKSKYFVESLDFLLKTTVLGSPADRLRILEGAYASMKPGENHETDLVMENKIKEKKDVTRSVGANKDEKSIRRATSASETVTATTENFYAAIGVKKKSTRHTDKLTETGTKKLKSLYRKTRPFQFHSGRKFKDPKAKVPSSPFSSIKVPELKAAVKRKTGLLLTGSVISCDDDEEVYPLDENDTGNKET